jgi:hypothetical protein
MNRNLFLFLLLFACTLLATVLEAARKDLSLQDCRRIKKIVVSASTNEITPETNVISKTPDAEYYLLQNLLLIR